MNQRKSCGEGEEKIKQKAKHPHYLSLLKKSHNELLFKPENKSNKDQVYFMLGFYSFIMVTSLHLNFIISEVGMKYLCH